MEDCLALSAQNLKQLGMVGDVSFAGGLVWPFDRMWNKAAMVRYLWSPRRGGSGGSIMLYYTIVPTYGRHRVQMSIEVSTTAPTYGGNRYWLRCPLVRNGAKCDRSLTKLFLPPMGRYFGCRHCHGLTYRSCQDAHKRSPFDHLVGTRSVGALNACTLLRSNREGGST